MTHGSPGGFTRRRPRGGGSRTRTLIAGIVVLSGTVGGSAGIAAVWRWAGTCALEAARCQEASRWAGIAKNNIAAADQHAIRMRSSKAEETGWYRAASALGRYWGQRARPIAVRYRREAEDWRSWRTPSEPVDPGLSWRGEPMPRELDRYAPQEVVGGWVRRGRWGPRSELTPEVGGRSARPSPRAHARARGVKTVLTVHSTKGSSHSGAT